MRDLQFEKSFISAKIAFMYCKLPIIFKNPQKNFEKNRKFAKKVLLFYILRSKINSKVVKSGT